jgi:hypothetical protein
MLVGVERLVALWATGAGVYERALTVIEVVVVHIWLIVVSDWWHGTTVFGTVAH